MAAENHNHLIADLQFHLHRAEAANRAPNGIDDALRNVCHDQNKNTPERRLLEVSLPGWVALTHEPTCRSKFNELTAGEVFAVSKMIEQLGTSEAFEKDVRHIFLETGRQGQTRRGTYFHGMVQRLC